MKPTLLIAAAIMLFTPHTQAQVNKLHEKLQKRSHRPPMTALQRCGTASLAVGCVGATFGLFLWSADADVGGRGGNNDPQPSPNYSGLIMAGVGGVLIAGGIILFVLDKAHYKKNRKLGITFPRMNEIGIAYHF